jgi:hypothetical protein
MPSEPFYADHHPPLFRGIHDSLAEFHLEGSECCLIHQGNPLTRELGVWLNPNMLVECNKIAYDTMNDHDIPNSVLVYMRSIWINRLRRSLTSDSIKRFVVMSRISRWKKADPVRTRTQNGLDCLISEMQVLVHSGWRLV